MRRFKSANVKIKKKKLYTYITYYMSSEFRFNKIIVVTRAEIIIRPLLDLVRLKIYI